MAGRKKISFNHKPTGVRSATIEVEGYEPFKIKFRVPKKGAALALGAAFGTNDFDAKADATVQYIASHLVEWSLEAEPTLENLEALEPTAAVAQMFFKIATAGAERKN